MYRVAQLIAILFFATTSLLAQDSQPRMSLNILDPATGGGMEGVRIRWRDFRNGGQVKGEVITGTDGTALIPMPKPGAQFFQLYISKPGYVTLRGYWPYSRGRGMVGDVEGTREPPVVYEVTMEPAYKASGKVLDQDGKPIEGATVVITANKKITTPNTATDIYRRKVKTGADGVFSIDDAPKPIDVAEISVFHPLYGNAASGYSTIRDYQTPEKLLDGSATFTLEKGVIVEGTITGPDGKSVSGATIIWGSEMPNPDVMPEMTTDAEGKYRVGSQPNIQGTLTVKARGLAPVMKKVDVKNESVKMDIQLRPARRITGRVIPPNGQRLINNGYIYIFGWPGANTIGEQIWFGSDGHFVWTDAPYDEVGIYVKAYGYPVVPSFIIKPEDKEITITLGEPEKPQ